MTKTRQPCTIIVKKYETDNLVPRECPLSGNQKCAKIVSIFEELAIYWMTYIGYDEYLDDI